MRRDPPRTAPALDDAQDPERPPALHRADGRDRADRVAVGRDHRPLGALDAPAPRADRGPVGGSSTTARCTRASCATSRAAARSAGCRSRSASAGRRPALPEGVIGRVQLTPYRMELAGVGDERDRLPRADARDPRGGHDRGRRAADRAHRGALRRAGSRSSTSTSRASAVRAGAPLAEIYSPDLVSTQQEYLAAYGRRRELRAGDRRGRSGDRAGPIADAQALVEPRARDCGSGASTTSRSRSSSAPGAARPYA